MWLKRMAIKFYSKTWRCTLIKDKKSRSSPKMVRAKRRCCASYRAKKAWKANKLKYWLARRYVQACWCKNRNLTPVWRSKRRFLILKIMWFKRLKIMKRLFCWATTSASKSRCNAWMISKRGKWRRKCVKFCRNWRLTDCKNGSAYSRAGNKKDWR